MTDAELTWLTPAAHQKLVDELEELTTTGRIEIAERYRGDGEKKNEASRYTR